MPKVSVVITTYNRSKFLPRAVESAHNAGSDVEVIVVNNGSTDDTDEVCRKMTGIKYVRLEKNANPGGGRNAGILASSTPYIAFLDDDDVRLPGSIDLQVKILEENPEAALIYGQMICGDEDCNPSDKVEPIECPAGDIFWKMLEVPFIPCLSVIIRRSCLDKVGLFDSSLAAADDFDLWVRIAEVFPVASVQFPVGICRVPRLTSNNVTSNLPFAYRMCLLIQNKSFNLPRARKSTASFRRLVRKTLLNRTSDMLILAASDAVTQGLSRTARSNLLNALMLNPARAARPWTFKLLLQSLMSKPTT